MKFNVSKHTVLDQPPGSHHGCPWPPGFCHPGTPIQTSTKNQQQSSICHLRQPQMASSWFEERENEREVLMFCILTQAEYVTIARNVTIRVQKGGWQHRRIKEVQHVQKEEIEACKTENLTHRKLTSPVRKAELVSWAHEYWAPHLWTWIPRASS